MKFLKKLFKWIAIILVALVILLYIFDYSYILKGVRVVYLTGHNTAFIDDYPYFENDTIKKGTDVSPWPIHKDYNSVKETEKLSKVNKDWGTIAYMIIKNDSIWFENYYENFDENSKTNSFSMAKSITTSMLGKAIMDGYIKSLDQPISDFYPEYKGEKTTVGDLASMASGLDWVEDYKGPFSITARANYDDDLAETMLNQKIVETPGKEFKYLSGDTQLLGMILQKATGKSLATYLSESFWEPMGATDDALWQLDDGENRLAKAFCCISSNARDFARFGKLYKDHGKWHGKQLLDSVFVAKSITPRFKESPQYGYGWWMKDIGKKHFFMMRGHLGQYVIVEPDDNVIIVRLGHRKSPDEAVGRFTDDITVYIEEAYKMLEK
ncbi:CubicO group peptidase (beta-lactamase class C family) [Mariniflexile fucanivorans]|uniref:CubicO group peptidase (Beta-lactamase class C family) n=1 Tax=Mariniflexile fucanivorans TaxID=264023 RepID=A0A4R1RT67_9FLAO|nr:serine hydrolase [Mariniflexile fucanivorans]TCL69172.1 CubicO group peptidase (beta-lactamase class C family) [Mariniflexile fucanivorans]